MKKELKKKLVLSKSTISDLNNEQMINAKGGIDVSGVPCISNIPHKCARPGDRETEGPQFACLTYFGCTTTEDTRP